MGWEVPQGFYDVMKIDKYFQHRCYTKRRFRDVRCKVNKFLNEQYGIRETVSHRPHKAKKAVRLRHPEHGKDKTKVSRILVDANRQVHLLR